MGQPSISVTVDESVPTAGRRLTAVRWSIWLVCRWVVEGVQDREVLADPTVEARCVLNPDHP